MMSKLTMIKASVARHPRRAAAAGVLLLLAGVLAAASAIAETNKASGLEVKAAKFVYPAVPATGELRDPFESLLGDGGEPNMKMIRQEGDLKLTGVVYGGGTTDYAVINGDVFAVGDIIGVYQIKKIASDRVLLTSDQKEVELVLPEDMIYPTPQNGGNNAKK